MSAPVLTPTVNGSGPFAPGATITGSWTVTDADNSTETISFKGVDSQGNEVTGSVMIARQDTFTMTEVKWERTGATLVFDNATRTFTGTVPSAP